MKRTVFLALFFFYSSSLFADATYKAAEELVKVTDLQGTMQSMVPMSADTAIRVSPQLQPYRGTLINFYKSVFSSKELMNDFTQLYADEFTAKELKELTAFYKTSTGKKALVLLPKISQEGMKLGQKYTQKEMPRLQKMLIEAQGKKK